MWLVLAKSALAAVVVAAAVVAHSNAVAVVAADMVVVAAAENAVAVAAVAATVVVTVAVATNQQTLNNEFDAGVVVSSNGPGVVLFSTGAFLLPTFVGTSLPFLTGVIFPDELNKQRH